MAKQEYVLKKFVKAESAKDALEMDSSTPVTEVFLVDNKPSEISTHAVGFKTVEVSE